MGQALGGVRVGREAALEQPVQTAASTLLLRAFALLQPVVRCRALVTVEAVTVVVAADEATDATHGPEGIGGQRAGRNSGC